MMAGGPAVRSGLHGHDTGRFPALLQASAKTSSQPPKPRVLRLLLIRYP